jgi:hypothetical protein
MERSTMLLVALSVLASAVPGGAAEAKQSDLCTQTSRAARHACENDVRHEFWIAAGVCTNTPDATARKACRAAAREEQREAPKECAEQFAAREDVCDAIGQAAYAPAIDPARFLAPAAIAADPNPFFPLVPGTIWVYRSGSETITVTVTDRTTVILGVTCVVVTDVVADDGTVVEDTDDFFAQDADGTVWYFGEISRNFENGELSNLDGSWRAGVDGARPGTIMKRMPVVGETYRQEFALGEAEDVAQVVSITASASVPAATCTGDCVLTRDFAPLEPGVEEQKYYARGIGLILETDVETGERVELVSFTAG